MAGALLGGVAASGGILAMNQLADRLGLTDLDLPRVLGLTFRDPDDAGTKLAGVAWYFTSGGLLVPGLYWLGFRLLGRSGAQPGLALGVAHWLISGALLAATRPRRPKRSRGKGRPLGSFVSEYGALEWTANALGHLAYGFAVGTAARHVTSGQRRRPLLAPGSS